MFDDALPMLAESLTCAGLLATATLDVSGAGANVGTTDLDRACVETVSEGVGREDSPVEICQIDVEQLVTVLVSSIVIVM